MKAEEVLKFAKQVGISKKLKRSGWVREGVKNPESVAEHSFRLIVLSMTLASVFKVDQSTLIKMAIIHDLGESTTGDLVVERGSSVDNESKQKKERLEEKAISRLTSFFGTSYEEIFLEMIERKSKEAKLFWQLDKLEMAIQASEYRSEQNLDPSEFISNAKLYIKEPLLKEILELL